jgi:methionine-rich copper-binding protein CopC
MPLGGPHLTTDTIAFIRQWITAGAPPSVTAGVAAHFAVTAIVPDSTEPVTESPPQIMVAFSHDLDVSQLATHSVHIEKLAPGTAPVVTEKLPARISVPEGNLRALLIWPSRPLSVGHYRVVIDAESSARFSGIAGQSVDVGAPDELGESVLSTFDVEVVP